MTFWKKLFGDKPDTGQPVEDDFDPAALLERAQREMQEMHARNRERAVAAISQKNNLEQMVIQLERKVASIQAKVEIAEKQGDTTLAEQLRHEVSRYQASIETTRESWQQAVQTAEHVKTAIRSEEERIRKKTTEALLLKAQWNTMQVQRSLFASLVEINTGMAQEVPDEERAVRHGLNRRFVRQAIVQRDNLRQMQADTERRVMLLRENAKQARIQQNDDLENALLREMEQYEAILVQTRDVVHQAEDVTGRAIGLLKEEEESLRTKGLDPTMISEEQVALYEARTALADAEIKRTQRYKKQRSGMVLVAVLIVLAIIAFTLAFV